MISFLRTIFHPFVDACCASLPFHYRCRMLLLLPFTFISYTWKSLPYVLNRPFVVYRIPTRRPGETVRALIYNHPGRHQTPAKGRLRPLHVDIHGGGFIGGIPEYDAPFCTQVAKTTGAVVVSVAYRFAPRYPYPAAHDDVEDAIVWLVKNAEGLLGADPELLTVSGSSAGGTLALGTALNLRKREGKDLIKGILELVERLQKDYVDGGGNVKAKSHTKRIDKLVFEGQWHGWLDWSPAKNTRRSPPKTYDYFGLKMSSGNAVIAGLDKPVQYRATERTLEDGWADEIVKRSKGGA
ncbi:MAG: hypothetical protein Q9212_004543 [Teloschistes hypoglaucus]